MSLSAGTCQDMAIQVAITAHGKECQINSVMKSHLVLGNACTKLKNVFASFEAT